MKQLKNNNNYYFRGFPARFAIIFLLVIITSVIYAQQPVSEYENSIAVKYSGNLVNHLFPAKQVATIAANFPTQPLATVVGSKPNINDVTGESLFTFRKYNNKNPMLSAFGQDSIYTATPGLVTPEERTRLIGDTLPMRDLTDVIRRIFKKDNDSLQEKSSAGIAILPTFGYNPSLGFQIGAKVAAGKYFGNPENTNASVFGIIAVYTSKGIANFQAIHNVFTAENKMNWQGNWQLTFFAIDDYGIGPGKYYPDSLDFIKFKFLRFFEKAYVKVAPNLFLGGGLNFNIRVSIDDRNQSPTYNTAHQNYSLENGFDPTRYSANGIIGAIQYITRENPIRSYGGIYADLSLQLNQQWLGSTKNALQLQYDFRKYWSMSNRNPAHVLAIWQTAAYKLSGTLPYLELPNTANDAYARSGRGYTIGRFKGPSYFYVETEYRFPIMRNQLISGVCFINAQSASDKLNKNLFNSWATAAGGGLRLLFQKKSRSTICFDYAVGQFGSKGFFIGLNEVF